MFDHVSIGVKDLARALRFYDAILTPLGYERLSKTDTVIGYGSDRISLWIAQVETPVPADRGSGLHFCFVAPNAAAVDAFHAAGVSNGGEDNGLPGLRPEYSQFYYAGFLVDPDGYRLEAFFKLAE
ncbi:VOC family protein [Rhizobium herbae]